MDMCVVEKERKREYGKKWFILSDELGVFVQFFPHSLIIGIFYSG